MILDDKKKVDYSEEDKERFYAMTPEEHYLYQVNGRGPVPREYQLSPKDRHKAKHITWEPSSANRLIAITIPDYACPSFCTFDMDAFGEVSALSEYCRAWDAKRIESSRQQNAHYKTDEEIAEAKEKGRWRKEESDLTDRLNAALRGEQVTWASMGACKLVPDRTPHIYASVVVDETEFEFVHYNVWDWIYTFTAEKVHTDVVWLGYIPQRYIFKDEPFDSDEPDSPSYINAMANAILSTDSTPSPVFVRAIRSRMEVPSACYSNDALFDVVGQKRWGDAEAFATRLFLVDKRFDTIEKLTQDREAFNPATIDYSCVFAAMLGDG